MISKGRLKIAESRSSVVLVPTIVKTNLHQVGLMMELLENIDVSRVFTFSRSVSLVGIRTDCR